MARRRLVVKPSVSESGGKFPAEETLDGDACAYRGGDAFFFFLGAMDLFTMLTADAIMANSLGPNPRVTDIVSGGVSPAGARFRASA
jgi:hypothetical protein